MSQGIDSAAMERIRQILRHECERADALHDLRLQPGREDRTVRTYGEFCPTHWPTQRQMPHRDLRSLQTLRGRPG